MRAYFASCHHQQRILSPWLDPKSQTVQGTEVINPGPEDLRL